MEERRLILTRCPGCDLPFDPGERSILANSLTLAPPLATTNWRCDVCGQVAWSAEVNW